MNKTDNSIVLYDAGGLILLITIFGIPFGSIIDYAWNLIIFSIALLFITPKNTVDLSKGRRWLYCLFITILGIVIDWAYFELTWDTHFGKTGIWIPAMSQGLQFIWILMPLLMLWLSNFALSYLYLKLEHKPAIVLGLIIALFTAPWLLPTIPYLMGWVI
jgi:hypothetical protein